MLFSRYVILLTILLTVTTFIRFPDARDLASSSITNEDQRYFWQFNESNPFTMKIPPNAAYEEDSDKYMEFFAQNVAGEHGFVIAVEGWTYPIFFADETTPRYDVRLTEDYADYDVLKDVPIPDHAEPDPQADGHLVIIDNSTNIEYDFWEARKLSNGQWEASWGNFISLDSDGIYPYGLSARGSGFAATQGLVWPQEIMEGKIGHALFFSIDDPMVKAGGPIRPATESDGESTEPYALPEGARLQLNPSIDVSRLGLTRAEEIIARALQEYGMILGDRGGGISLYAARPENYDWGDTFGSLDPEEGYGFLFSEKISIKDFRVLKMGCQFQTISQGEPLPEYHLYLEGESITDDCPHHEENGSFFEDIPSFNALPTISALAIVIFFYNKNNKKYCCYNDKYMREKGR